jgi:hypothetical protein
MISKNSIQILEKQLYRPISLRVQQTCLQILRNLSDQAVKLVRIKKCLLIKFVEFFSYRKILIHFFNYLLNYYKQMISQLYHVQLALYQI